MSDSWIPIELTDVAVWRLDPLSGGTGFFSHYTAPSMQLSRQNHGPIDATTIKLRYPVNFAQPTPKHFESGMVALSRLADPWLDESNCEHLSVGHHIGDYQPLSAKVLLSGPIEWSYQKRHAHFLAHMGVWPTVWESCWARNKVALETMDSVAPVPENAFSRSEWRFFWGTNAGPNIGMLALKITLIANVSAAILQGDERARSITLDQWRQLMQEPRTAINSYEWPWNHFLNLPDHDVIISSTRVEALG